MLEHKVVFHVKLGQSVLLRLSSLLAVITRGPCQENVNIGCCYFTSKMKRSV